MSINERDTRKRLLINRHISKMTPEEIGRRFTVYLAPKLLPKSRRKVDPVDAATSARAD